MSILNEWAKSQPAPSDPIREVGNPFTTGREARWQAEEAAIRAAIGWWGDDSPSRPVGVQSTVPSWVIADYVRGKPPSGRPLLTGTDEALHAARVAADAYLAACSASRAAKTRMARHRTQQEENAAEFALRAAARALTVPGWTPGMWPTC